MKTLADLKKIREKAQEEMKLRGGSVRVKIVVGMGTSGIAMGAREVMKTFLEEIANRSLTDVLVTQTGEKGLASMEPVVDVIEEDKPKVTYGNMNPDKVRKVVVEHIVNGRIVSDYVVATGN
ncbi:MAG: (2Fe-2S) ferredoxin domain-containing protein [Candidatus Cloacimonadaceae bacterium]|jgi:(2Fe-2S) ferredoxin|nr:(2Fe-2S) ferredoxin domain-containing protein [Candidatus Cloacimonadota bacterium]MDX9950069.1 (2Fe-2S) ferredoxin domain-containing protein [Candidatus Syntrophosphaera sp.]NLN84688.1 (2Fe-2S) ferredoxin domain-containing protein [Candidatus Cloacimonadota bacterium]